MADSSKANTSASHPIRVDWLTTPWLGRIGLTFAPGRKQRDALSGTWDRDLAADLGRLRDDFGAEHLVCLLEDGEFGELGITGLPEAVRDAGMQFHRLPIPDGTTPHDANAVGVMASRIAGWAAAGESVVIHCKGGLGRAGTVGGCVLRASGMDARATLADLQRARGPQCPETAGQREFIARFQPAPPDRRSRVLGAVMGAAIGDALGHPTEFLSSSEIQARYGPGGVTGYELWWERDGGRFAPYTDDTQMAEIVLRALVDTRRTDDIDLVMQTMAAGFAHWADDPQGGHRAPGNACLRGARRLAAGVPWREAGGPAAGGCGSVMRAYPFGVVFAQDLGRAEHWAVEHSRLTHGDPIALAACAAMAVGVALEVRGTPAGTVLTAMVGAAGRHDAATARMAERAVADGTGGADPAEVLARLEGWPAHEAIAAAMFVVSRHPADIRAALLEGANAPGDSDSIATLAGALLGARLGLESVPPAWIRDVERSAELLELGKAAASAGGHSSRPAGPSAVAESATPG